ncbi:MBL fold metallo-hydrolase [Alkaliphilus sp. MSJ-5]|uniref:MBL fold metallo-hydrolase n=1 Tax=Alkaliphilus flagellatus TaxID=2841507 RepID=A0ABS6G2D3_9FIRM|nr:MBL fold metallo-hydrolase [Alkaliphilus flagellatus]MBU5675570.1 MBL fold metallo-hydrolase [Alkaliphilus flagellatus]
MGNKIVEGLSAMTSSTQQVMDDILVMEFTVVNAFIIGDPKAKDTGWILVDTGLENSADLIIESAEKRFGKNNPPKVIILTHGHFDHVGSVIKLSNLWDVPVYIHELEIPYITGQKDYPLADPSVDGGMIAQMSTTFPHTSIDLEHRAVSLPSDGSIPFMQDWKWIHTPGHSPGHICLFREKDGVIIAGDAFTTVKQESLFSVMTQSKHISGPPAYLTTDWQSAEKSINRIKNLNPSIVLPSHGKPIEGKDLDHHLEVLANHFKEIAVPNQGRFVE